jgi:Mechanosensitive ion channel
MHVDLQERHQLDVARERVAKVKARARPWQSIFAVTLAVIAATASVQARHTADEFARNHTSSTLLAPLGHDANRALEYGAAVAFFLLAGFATIGLGNKARDVLQPSVGSAHAAVIRFAILVVGGLCTIVVTLDLLNIAITQLILGGAVTGVIIGIAAQQSLANMFAGIVLLMARPFQVGDRVGIRAGALSGLIEGSVTEISVTYVRLETPSGPVHIPNSMVLAAAVGPAGAVPAPPGQSPSPAQQAPETSPGQEQPALHPVQALRKRRHPAGQDPAPGPGSATPGTPAPSVTPADLPAEEGARLSGAAAPPAAPQPAQADPPGPETQRDADGQPS